MASKRRLKIQTVEESKALKDLENGISNKDVSEKYGVPKNKIVKSGNVFNVIKILNDKKMRTVGYEDMDKAIFQRFLAKRSQNVPTDEVFLKEKVLHFAK